jgi:hypothetical protein
MCIIHIKQLINNINIKKTAFHSEYRKQLGAVRERPGNKRRALMEILPRNKKTGKQQDE